MTNTNTKYIYESAKGEVNVDEMSEVHLRNVLKKLLRDAEAPKGRVEVPAPVWGDDDDKLVKQALKALDTAKAAIATMQQSLTPQGEKHWQANVELLIEVQTDLVAIHSNE